MDEQNTGDKTNCSNFLPFEKLELSTNEIFSIIAGRGDEIINDRLFENLINIHKINNQRGKELFED